MSVHVERRIVPVPAVETAERRLHLEVLRHGLDGATLNAWLHELDWFPHLKYDESIVQLARALPASWQQGTLCDPQILVQFPHDGPVPSIGYHRDQEPEWAAGRKYVRIVGVPLTRWDWCAGGVRFADGRCPTLLPGDAVMFTPDELHTGGVNRSCRPRVGVYFRWLEAS